MKKITGLTSNFKINLRKKVLMPLLKFKLNTTSFIRKSVVTSDGLN